ncbi:MAG: hypothetical protein KBF80_02275 [Flavobacteriales bacterium]|nr:hypothetical protein [Flavobacteriales bacterium]
MNGPEYIKHMAMCNITVTPEEHIENATDRLLSALYIPVVTEDGRLIYQRDHVRCELFGVEEEAVNWGALKCAQVDAFADGRYRVIIEEASPDGCPTLCDYVARHLALIGWSCEVETEW